jgi:hypothetical protein
VPFTAGLIVALVAGFALCVAAALAVPELNLAHGWIALFSVEPVGTRANWIEGILGSVWFGLLFGILIAGTYNLLSRRS